MSVSRFYELELDKLLIEFEKIRLFTKHGPTIGSYREQVLRNYLRQFTPNNLAIGSGFVFDFIATTANSMFNEQTKQVDCLIFDENNYTPFLRTDEFVIIEPDSLFAAIEIKSELTFYKEYDKVNSEENEAYPLKYDSERPYKWAGTLVEAFENIRSISNIAKKYNRAFFKGIFAYSSSVNLKNLLFAFDNGELQLQLGLKHLNELPTYICVPTSSVILFNTVSVTEDEKKGFDPYQSYMSVMDSVPENKGQPLRFFTNGLKVQIDYNLIGKQPHQGGLFTAAHGNMRIWGHHFDLPSGQ